MRVAPMASFGSGGFAAAVALVVAAVPAGVASPFFAEEARVVALEVGAFSVAFGAGGPVDVVETLFGLGSTAFAAGVAGDAGDTAIAVGDASGVAAGA
jgi:hypothetical protein